MNKLISLLLSLFVAFPSFAAGPVIWGPSGAMNIAPGPVYDNDIPYIKQPTTNYIGNSSALVNTTGWEVSGAVTVTRVTSNLPRATTVGTGISLGAGAANDYVQYCFTIDENDKNTKLAWNWSQAPSSYANGDFVAQVFSFTSANCGGTPTQLNIDQVSTGQDYSIPDVNFPQDLTFDVANADYYGIRYVRKAGTSTLVISNVIVGPELPIPMPAVGPISTTWSFNNGDGTGFSGSSLVTNRVGDQLTVYGQIGPASGDGMSGSTFSFQPGPGITLTDGRGTAELYLENTTDTLKPASLAVVSGAIIVTVDDGVSAASLSGTSFGTSNGRYSRIRITSFTGNVAEWADSPNYVASAKQAVVMASAHRNSITQTGVNPNASAVQILMNSTAAVNSATLGYNIGNGYSTAGSSFTAPESGKYQVIGMILVQSTNVLANEYELQLTKGASFGSSTRVVSLDRRTPAISTSFTLKGVTEVNLTKGDTIYLALLGTGDNSSNTLTISGAPDVTNFQISRLTDEYGRPVVGFGYATPDSAGLVSTGPQSFAGVKTFNSGIVVPSHDQSYTFSNGSDYSQSHQVTLIRVGDFVIGTIKGGSLVTTSTSQNNPISTVAIPSNFRPSTNMRFNALVYDATTYRPGSLLIHTNGLMYMIGSPGGGQGSPTWTASGSKGWLLDTTFSYKVN